MGIDQINKFREKYSKWVDPIFKFQNADPPPIYEQKLLNNN